MQYINHYSSPLGEILLAADDTGLTGLWFRGQKYFARGLEKEHKECPQPVLDQAKGWLDHYFSGREPDFRPLLHLRGTPFQRQVWTILLTIPYGQTTTYGTIAARIAGLRGLSPMSSQAVGSAVGHNPISIIVPCHRVLGADGSLTGYAGGIEKKLWLLEHERSAAG